MECNIIEERILKPSLKTVKINPYYIKLTDTQKKNRKEKKKIEKWQEKLANDPETKKICSDYQNELDLIWNSEPERKESDVFDRGQIDDFNSRWKRKTVSRNEEMVLLRESNGIPVYWSEPLGNWVEIEHFNRDDLR